MNLIMNIPHMKCPEKIGRIDPDKTESGKSIRDRDTDTGSWKKHESESAFTGDYLYYEIVI